MNKNSLVGKLVHKCFGTLYVQRTPFLRIDDKKKLRFAGNYDIKGKLQTISFLISRRAQYIYLEKRQSQL